MTVFIVVLLQFCRDLFDTQPGFMLSRIIWLCFFVVCSHISNSKLLEYVNTFTIKSVPCLEEKNSKAFFSNFKTFGDKPGKGWKSGGCYSAAGCTRCIIVSSYRSLRFACRSFNKIMTVIIQTEFGCENRKSGDFFVFVFLLKRRSDNTA